MKADIVLGLQRGDEGKGKCTNSLLTGALGVSEYDCVLRWNGGPNAGHTFYIDEKKVVTHSLPTGVVHGLPSVIGPGCLVDPIGLIEEIKEVEATLGYSIRELIKIDYRVHLIDAFHVIDDSKNDEVGSTGRGIMPTLRDKFGRKGKRAEILPFPWLKKHGLELVDVNTFLIDDWNVLCEGAQGFYLDIDWGDYPYISSTCLPGAVNSSGIPLKSIDRIIGVSKAYETYVGTRGFEPGFDYVNMTWNEESDFAKLRELGQEYGATTGRPRQCHWLNLDELKTAVRLSSCTDLVITKVDILERMPRIGLIENDEVFYVKTISDFKSVVRQGFPDSNLIFSESPYRI